MTIWPMGYELYGLNNIYGEGGYQWVTSLVIVKLLQWPKNDRG
jgi:hypothetical protein